VTIITGHEDPTKPESAMNWQALAQSASTLVFVMGMKNLPNISARLIENGLDPKTPAALVMWATTPHHRSTVTTLDDLPAAAEREGFSNPSLIVVGKVAELHDKLNWFEKKPLLGKSIVVTRAREQASGLANMLTDLGAEAIQFPTIAIRPVEHHEDIDAAIEALDSYSWVVFTSANGVKLFAGHMAAAGKDARAFANCKIAAIGPATAAAVRALGITPDYVPEAYIAESVAKGLISLGVAGQRILIPRARVAREVLAEELKKAGAVVNVLPVYDTVADLANKDLVMERINSGKLSAITFGSSSTVDNFFKIIPESVIEAHPEIALAAIGPVTANTLEKHGFKATVMPKMFAIPALVTELVLHFSSEDK
jgi:uroporphyrinogen III methyltransferase/synthase